MRLRAPVKIDDLVRNDHKLLGRSERPNDVEVVRAEGSLVHDARGRTFIDFQMGWCVGNLGWNPHAIMQAVRDFDGPSYVNPSAMYPPWVELAGLLAELVPGRVRRSYRATTGTEAVELALQLAMTFTRRRKLVSIDGAYHGNSFAARSLGAGGVDNLLHGCMKLALPLDHKALDRLETLVKHRDVAAFIMEPIITNLSVVIPDLDFMREIIPLCHQYGTLVIMDEVATGFGRTGALFACEHYDLAPDFICLAKAITSGVAPLAVTITTPDIANETEGELEFYSTFGWHPVAVEAAIATCRFWQRHHDHLIGNAMARSSEFRSRLLRMPWAVEPELRCRGLAIGIGLDDARYVERIRQRCQDEGLLVFAEDDSLVMFPALTLDEHTAREGLDILEHCAHDIR
ncbi:MAG: argD [Myxococcales bacterium]|nr:argD [Myxococcales bacterium]